jgi:predicted nuclease with TOPRIM domain
MAVLTHLTSNDLYDMDFHELARWIDAKIGNFEALDLVHTLRHLVQELEALKEKIEALQYENLELSVERDNLDDTVIELEQKLEKLEKEQADEQ